MSLGTIGAVVGVLLGLAALAGGSFGAWDLKQEVGSNTNWRLMQTYERLTLIRQKRTLSQLEWLQWCQAVIHHIDKNTLQQL